MITNAVDSLELTPTFFLTTMSGKLVLFLFEELIVSGLVSVLVGALPLTFPKRASSTICLALPASLSPKNEKIIFI